MEIVIIMKSLILKNHLFHQILLEIIYITKKQELKDEV